jgi:hypothetical protein
MVRHCGRCSHMPGTSDTHGLVWGRSGGARDRSIVLRHHRFAGGPHDGLADRYAIERELSPKGMATVYDDAPPLHDRRSDTGRTAPWRHVAAWDGTTQTCQGWQYVWRM